MGESKSATSSEQLYSSSIWAPWLRRTLRAAGPFVCSLPSICASSPSCRQFLPTSWFGFCSDMQRGCESLNVSSPIQSVQSRRRNTSQGGSRATNLMSSVTKGHVNVIWQVFLSNKSFLLCRYGALSVDSPRLFLNKSIRMQHVTKPNKRDEKMKGSEHVTVSMYINCRETFISPVVQSHGSP